MVAWNSLAVWPHGFHQDATDAAGSDKALAKLVADGDEAFIPIGDAMIDAIKKVCRERGWSPNRWILACDGSAARYGLMMAQAYPWTAVQLHSATGYEQLVKTPTVPWLVTSGWGGAGKKEAFEFSKLARTEKWPVIYKRYPGAGAGSRWVNRALAAEFFDYVLSLNNGRGVPENWAKDWDKPPVPEKYRTVQQEDPENPGKMIMIRPEVPENFLWNDYAPQRPKPTNDGEWFVEAVHRSSCTFDWRRGVRVIQEERKGVPVPWLVKLPNWQLAEAWSLVEHPYPELSENEAAQWQRQQDRMNGVAPAPEGEAPPSEADADPAPEAVEANEPAGEEPREA
ncbi:MAG: hypothetical protein HRU46_18715 [Verrucomicrobiales bacterium]|nr:hypothetical protein [Verrucomicrobiales bacterium]